MMKSIVLPVLCFVGSLTLSEAQEPFIPVALNAVLPKIHARMTIGEVKAVLAPAYPKLEVRMGTWSGGVGYIAYKLNERYTVSISAITREGKDVVHDDILIYLYDWPAKRRIDLKIYDWEKQADKQPEPKLEEPNKTVPGKP